VISYRWVGTPHGFREGLALEEAGARSEVGGVGWVVRGCHRFETGSLVAHYWERGWSNVVVPAGSFCQ